MIGVKVLDSSAGAARYHDNALKEDGPVLTKADNYYANERVNLIWQGKGAALLGIEGQEVTREQFVDFLEGRLPHPDTGKIQDLSINSKGAERRLGYDLTISAPKSVSIVALIGGDERVVQAHIDANRAAMTWLEEHGAQIRVKDGNGQNEIKPTGNLLYATVQHETSRENDPQLHNHNVVVAVTYDQGGATWRSLTNDEIFRIRTQADTIYKAELTRSLRAAGYDIAYRTNGIDFELRGLEPAHIEAFSQRSLQMREALIARGIDPDGASHQARQDAVLATRSRKIDLDKDYLRAIWTDKAKEVGLDVAAVMDRARVAGQQVLPEAQLARDGVTRAIKHLSEREQAFPVSKVESEAIFFSRGAGLAAIKQAIDDRKEDRSLVDRVGRGIPTLTTSAAIAQELTLQDSIWKGKSRGRAIVPERDQFELLLARFEARKTTETGSTFKLSMEQVNAARNVLMHEDKFQGIQGDAGTGKTAALEFVREVASTRGWETLGIATSTTGARELEKATGIRSQTVAAFLTERDERIRMLQAELRQLEVDFAHSPGTLSQVKRVARRDLVLSGRGYGAGRYVFDSKSGEVLKAETGRWHPLNRLGVKLQGAGQRTLSAGAESSGRIESFADRFRAKAALVAGTIQVAAGRSLTTYEAVDLQEAKSARAEHREQNVRERERRRAYMTKTAQVENLIATGNPEGRPFLLVMDESSMTGAKDSARISEIARDMGARIVLQGDIKQHGSVSAGRAFLQTQLGGINLSKIEETRRFDNATPQQKDAVAEMKQGRFARALEALDTTLTDDLYGMTAKRFVENRRQLIEAGIAEPKIGVVAIVNEDRKAANQAIRSELRKEGILSGPDHVKQHLDDPKLTEQQYQFVPSLAKEKVDRLTALRDYKTLGIVREELLTVVDYDLNGNRLVLERQNGRTLAIDPSKYTRFSFARMEERQYAVGDIIEARGNIGRLKDTGRVANGTRGEVLEIGVEGARVRWQDGKETSMTNAQLRHVDHAYAHTSHKEQGVTNHREIFLVSPKGAHRLNREASYVAASRAKDNTEIVTSQEARAKMLANAGKTTDKTTAIDIGQNLSPTAVQQARPRKVVNQETQLTRRGTELGM